MISNKNMYEETIPMQHDEERNADREREMEREEMEYTPIVEKMMGESFKDYFDTDEDRTLERDNNDLTDAMIGAI